MIQPAPYTRETLDRMRKGASAAELGWMSAFYRNVCVKHGIEPVANPVLKSVPMMMAPPPPPKEIPGLRWNSKTLELSRGDAVIALSPRMASVFDILWKQFAIDDAYLSSHIFREVKDCARNAISRAVTRFNFRARELRVRVETKPSVGYRLIDLAGERKA